MACGWKRQIAKGEGPWCAHPWAQVALASPPDAAPLTAGRLGTSLSDAFSPRGTRATHRRSLVVLPPRRAIGSPRSECLTTQRRRCNRRAELSGGHGVKMQRRDGVARNLHNCAVYGTAQRQCILPKVDGKNHPDVRIVGVRCHRDRASSLEARGRAGWCNRTSVEWRCTTFDEINIRVVHGHTSLRLINRRRENVHRIGVVLAHTRARRGGDSSHGSDDESWSGDRL